MASENVISNNCLLVFLFYIVLDYFIIFASKFILIGRKQRNYMKTPRKTPTTNNTQYKLGYILILYKF